MSDGNLLGLVPLVVGAGITLAALNYFLPENRERMSSSTANPRFKSALEAAGI